MKSQEELLAAALQELNKIAFRLDAVIAELGGQRQRAIKATQKTSVPAECQEFRERAAEECRKAGIKDAQALVRCVCMLAFRKEANTSDECWRLSNVFAVSPLTIRRWRIAYENSGVVGLVPKKSTGRPRQGT